MEFGNLLRSYIQTQGLAVYQLARDAGIDRSFLQGVLSGARKLPIKRFSDVVSTQYFTAQQVDALCRQYFSERFGNDKLQRFATIEQGLRGDLLRAASTVPAASAGCHRGGNRFSDQ